MSHSGSGNSGKRDSSFFSGFMDGLKKGPSAYFDKRKFTLSGQKGPNEPSSSGMELLSKVGPRNTVNLFKETYHGVMSHDEQQQTQKALGKTSGTITGSVGTGVVIGRSLNMLKKSVPKRFQPIVGLMQLSNYAMAAMSLYKTPEYLNQSLKETAPTVHKIGSDMLPPIVKRQTTPNLQFDVESLTSLFSHSSQQRLKTGKSSFESLEDLSRIRSNI